MSFKEYLNEVKNWELQALATATSEQEMYRLQGRIAFLVRLEQLPERVKETLNRKDEE
jgi:hypothetical protein